MSECQHLKTLAAEIFQLIGEENYSQLDSILANVCPAEQTEVEMLALLRYSFSARHHLVNYHIYLDQVAQELLSRGKDVEMLLRGLPFYSIDRYP
jgi:hypothetical protein